MREFKDHRKRLAVMKDEDPNGNAEAAEVVSVVRR